MDVCACIAVYVKNRKDEYEYSVFLRLPIMQLEAARSILNLLTVANPDLTLVFSYEQELPFTDCSGKCLDCVLSNYCIHKQID